MPDRATSGGGWWPSDEIGFIKQMRNTCLEKGLDPVTCLSGYLGSISSRRDWGRYIREDDVHKFIREAKNQLIIVRQQHE